MYFIDLQTVSGRVSVQYTLAILPILEASAVSYSLALHHGHAQTDPWAWAITQLLLLLLLHILQKKSNHFGGTE
jgi:hypothetical protein